MREIKPYKKSNDGFDYDSPTYVDPPASTKAAAFFVSRVFVPIIMSVTPLAITFLLIILVFSAFQRSTEAGVRSFAATILPVTLGAFVVWIDRLDIQINKQRQTELPFDHKVMEKAITGFIGAVIWGLLAMFSVQIIASFGLAKLIPAAELVWAITLSLLIR